MIKIPALYPLHSAKQNGFHLFLSYKLSLTVSQLLVDI